MCFAAGTTARGRLRGPPPRGHPAAGCGNVGRVPQLAGFGALNVTVTRTQRSFAAAGPAVGCKDRAARWITRYLSIQQARFDDRVEIVWRIGEGTLDALVPQMVLQPLVENAFRHGMARRRAGGRVELSAERDDATLRLSVRDDGPQLDPAPGTGLASTRARLALLHADAAELSLARDGDACTVAMVRLPFHLAPVSPA